MAGLPLVTMLALQLALIGAHGGKAEAEHAQANQASATTSRAVLGNETFDGCLPTCRWMCSEPECPATCTPQCLKPKCEHKCKELHVGHSNCTIRCEKPECEVRCIRKTCKGGPCPKCENVCQVPRCQSVCTPTAPECTPSCDPPSCTWICKKPKDGCPKPKCQLVCGSASGEGGGLLPSLGTDVESQEACFRSRHGQDQRKAAEGRAGEAAEKQRETVGRRECCTCEHLRNLHAAYKEASSTQNNANSASVRAAHKGGKHHSGSHHSSSSHHHNNHNHKSDMHSFPSFLEVHHEFQFRLQNKLKQNLECCPCSSAETNIAKSDLSPMRLTMEPEVRVVARFRELLPAEDEGHDVKAAMREISGEAEDNIYVNPNYVKQKLVALE